MIGKYELGIEEELEDQELDLGQAETLILTEISTISKKKEYIKENMLKIKNIESEITDLKKCLDNIDCPNCAGKMNNLIIALETGTVEPYHSPIEETHYIYTDRHLEEIARSYI